MNRPWWHSPIDWLIWLAAWAVLMWLAVEDPDYGKAMAVVVLMRSIFDAPWLTDRR